MTKTDENQLSARQLSALPHFVTCSSIETACKAADISKDTFYKWLKDPIFKTELESLRNEIVNEAIGVLKVNTTKAAMVLSLLLDREDSPSVQRSAANDIIGHVMKFIELKEIEERLNSLEIQLRNKNS